MKETATKAMIMTNGVTAKIMNKGANTAFKFNKPMRYSQVDAQPMTLVASIHIRTWLTASSQYMAPKPITMTAIKINGSKDNKITLG